MKKYEKYKESKLPGINIVPSHWQSIKLKFIGTLYSGLTGKKGDDFYDEDNVRSKHYINFKNIANNLKINPYEYDLVAIEDNEIQNQVKKGDLFFLMSSENFEDIGKTSVLLAELNETYLNSFCRGFRIFDKNFDPSFLNYLLLSQDYRQILSNEAKGFTRINIQVGKINNFKIYSPFNRSEQSQIADFLDYHIGIIDQLINQKVKLIDLLREQCQAIINETVSKGLNPNVETKDSGVQWIDKIPIHWGIAPLKHVAVLKGRLGWKGLKAEEYVSVGYGFLSTPDIKDEIIDFKSINYITKERYFESPEIMLEIDDVLLVKDGSTLGIANIVRELPIPSTVNSSIGVIRIVDKKTLLPEYLLNLLSSNYFQAIVNQQKAGQGVPHLFQKDIKNFLILIPPLNEQRLINEKISEAKRRINELLNSIELQVEKFIEYRQSLISEAVTGKIDIREWQPNQSYSA